MAEASVLLSGRSQRVDEFYKDYIKGYMAHSDWFMDDRFMHVPRLLSIETFVKCNATCEFCPYPTSTRIGQKLDLELVHKIIDDIAAAEVHPEFFVPSRLNEPLLDKRLYAICDYAAQKLPTTKIRHFTNGTTLTARHVERLLSTPNLDCINVSLNSHIADEHRRLMGIDFAKVVTNLRHLHGEIERAGLPILVYLSRVGDGTEADVDFIDWCKVEFPRFHPLVYVRFDWLGKTYGGIQVLDRELGCNQWFNLNFLADGREAFCSIDDDGLYGVGNVRHQNALDIYNHPVRLALRQKKKRAIHPACSTCAACL